MNFCVTLNPCLDKSLVVPPWQPGEHQVRGREFGLVVGGKGVNVARGLRRLGLAARPVLFLGGELGQLCDRLLREQDGFEPVVTWTAAPTREILTVRTEDTAQQTAFFDPNPAILPRERDDLEEKLAAAFRAGAAWCAMSGSSPCPATDDFYARVIRRAKGAGVRTVLDTYGACLAPALQARPDVVKMNRAECEEALGLRLEQPAAVRDALEQLRGRGIAIVAITFGARGMAGAWDDQIAAWQPPPIEVVNPIGSGDAMSAALIDALSRGDDPRESLQWAMACAAANVQRWVACDFRRADAAALLPGVAPCPLEHLVACASAGE